MNYPFSMGDLRDSSLVLFNYIEAQNAVKVPWDDLRYIFGEIMYGGHIIDIRDRLLCTTYLDFFMQVKTQHFSSEFSFIFLSYLLSILNLYLTYLSTTCRHGSNLSTYLSVMCAVTL